MWENQIYLFFMYSFIFSFTYTIYFDVNGRYTSQRSKRVSKSTSLSQKTSGLVKVPLSFALGVRKLSKDELLSVGNSVMV